MSDNVDLRDEIAKRLRALEDLGVTELWIAPAQENDERLDSDRDLAAAGGESDLAASSVQPADHSAADRSVLLEALRRDEIGDCTRCKLAAKRRTIVFGSGNPNADLMFVGEGPGADEDEQGLPFVGRAGQLLTKMIESMVVGGRKLRREEVYIANIVKCRPPGNRDPEPEEIEACEGFLFEQIAIIEPRVIVTLGAFAARTLLRSKAPISALRGRFHEYRGTLLMPTFHPAYVLRNYTEQTRRAVYEDLKKAAAELERAALGG